MQDFKVLQEGYILAQNMGRHDDAARLRQMLEKLQQDSPERVTARDAAQLELNDAERLLYRMPPQGFTESLALLDALPSRVPAVVKEPRYHVLRAAALGQHYAFAKAQASSTPSQLDTIAALALNAITAAQAAGQGDWLRYLADPAHAGGAGQDDDLVELAERPDVRAVLLRG
jgi:hypothetical protein